MTQRLPISQIRTDGGTQPRAFLNHEVIEEYIEAIQAGAKFPPIDVFFDGEHYWLADGFHRRSAFFGAECEEILCNVHQGTLQDAQWFSYAANKTNGLYRSNADKQRAIQAALRHPASAGLSDSQIAKHVGVDHKTVAAWRDRILGNSQDSQPAPTRTATRNGKTYEINVSNIGKAKATPKKGEDYEDHIIEQAAAAVGVSHTTVWRANEVKRASPEAFERLKSGKSTIDEEYERVCGGIEAKPTMEPEAEPAIQPEETPPTVTAQPPEIPESIAPFKRGLGELFTAQALWDDGDEQHLSLEDVQDVRTFLESVIDRLEGR
jgi:transposase